MRATSLQTQSARNSLGSFSLRAGKRARNSTATFTANVTATFGGDFQNGEVCIGINLGASQFSQAVPVRISSPGQKLIFGN